jgi:hypothetical protein
MKVRVDKVWYNENGNWKFMCDLAFYKWSMCWGNAIVEEEIWQEMGKTMGWKQK